MPRIFIASVVLSALAIGSGVAGAQGLQPPRSTAGGVFGGQEFDPNSPQQLSLTFDMFGGYDDYAEPQADPTVPTFDSSGYVSRASAGLNYRRGRSERFFGATGNAFWNHHGVHDYSMYGGGASIAGGTPISGRVGIRGDIGVAYEPSYLFNAFGPIAGDLQGAPVPGSSPALGITEQRWVTPSASGGIYRNWTPRQRMDITYQAMVREPVTGPGWRSESQSLSAQHNWNARERVGLDFNYRFDYYTSRQGEISLPVRGHSFLTGVHMQKPITPTRNLTAYVRGGFSHAQVQSQGGVYESLGFVPAGAAQIRADLSRTWSLSGDISRDITLLEGITPEPFATNSFSTSLLGLISPRLQVSGSVSYSKGGALETEQSSFTTYGYVAQAQYAVSSCCAMFGNYRFYQHELTNVPGVQPDFPLDYDSSSVQVGFTVWLSLVGRSSRPN